MSHLREQLAIAKSSIEHKDYQEAFRILRSEVSPQDDFVVQTRAAKLTNLIPSSALGLRHIKVAILASHTVDHFSEILKYWMAREGFAADIWIAPFDTITPTIFDTGSELYAFNPDIVWLFTTSHNVRIKAASVDEVRPSVENSIQNMVSLWHTLSSNLNCTILQNNADIPSFDDFGNFAGQALWSRRNCLRLYNLELAAAITPEVILFDLEHVSARYGKQQWIDSRYWYHSKHAFSFDACGLLAFQASRLIAAHKGLAKKCVVLDLDNTLWGGVIGDDGLAGIKLGNGADGEAFVDFQRYVLSLKERGIILAVCSKNDEANATEPFLKHPDCLLKLDDFAVFCANWNNKADNISDIATMLNIGLDSMVFVDDNPAERDLVRQFLPMVAVPELPEDPSGYIEAIDRFHYFETTSFSAEDRERARYYRENAKRSQLMGHSTDTSHYLNSLNMFSEAGELDTFHLPRMSQLINKSNQFHLTGTRYSEAELLGLAERTDCAVRWYKLNDRFGSNGLISVIVLIGEPGKNAIIDTWVMSCRVLGRTMEEFICNDIIEISRKMGCTSILGYYLPTAKNKLVSGLYERLGFEKHLSDQKQTVWALSITPETPFLSTHVGSAAVNPARGNS